MPEGITTGNANSNKSRRFGQHCQIDHQGNQDYLFNCPVYDKGGSGTGRIVFPLCFWPSQGFGLEGIEFLCPWRKQFCYLFVM
ncbi:hypothetical Protein YC6258_04581 [Gynuella sunshinyii YC6258]|uniref:Uncharacterized protein n=1 Tax=Gynuella sunshinyii YC6258 TaxID=1445510 RepID=A0A0C5VTH5_9GAMM|nr:hypothetical Protein YC6258_04581 [Gynuella sunshinyii YC6258]